MKYDTSKGYTYMDGICMLLQRISAYPDMDLHHACWRWTEICSDSSSGTFRPHSAIENTARGTVA